MERSAHFVGRQGTAVEAKTVAVFTRREAVFENPRQVFWRDPDAVVAHFNPNPFVTISRQAHGDLLVRSIQLAARGFGVANEIHQDLQDLVLIDKDAGYR